MDPLYYEITDACRKNLTRYTLRALRMLPPIENPRILDIGCGSGVPTMALLQEYPGYNIHAADNDDQALERLHAKAAAAGFLDRLTITRASLFDDAYTPEGYDIILAEGLLNAVGMTTGLPRLISLAKSGACLVIHDELKDDQGKRALFREYGLHLLGSFELDEQIWWNEYYKCLDTAIGQSSRPELFQAELQYIRMFSDNPRRFLSVFYILQKEV